MAYYNFEAFRLAAEKRAQISRIEFEFVVKEEVERIIKEKYEFYEFLKKYPLCSEEGCEFSGIVECILFGDLWNGDSKIYYCPVHAKENGFCPGCGNYYDGTNEFMYNGGWCDNCYSEICQQMSDERNEAEELGIDVFDL